MLSRSQPGMSRMQGYCWCSESYRRHSQKWRSGLQWKAKGESKVGLRSRRFQQRCLESSCIEDFSTRSSKTRYTRSVRWPDHYGHEWLAMKLLPKRLRETQTQWFDKRGISWHFSAVVHESNHTDYLVVSISERAIHTYVVVIYSCKQDWFSFSCILEEGLVCVKEPH